MQALSDCVYLPYLKHYTDKCEIDVCIMCSEGKCLKVSLANFCSESYLLRVKTSLAQLDEHDEKSARPTSDLTRNYERASDIF